MLKHRPVNSRGRWWRCGDIWTDMPARMARSTCRPRWSWSWIWLAVKCWSSICCLRLVGWEWSWRGQHAHMHEQEERKRSSSEINTVITCSGLSAGAAAEKWGLTRLHLLRHPGMTSRAWKSEAAEEEDSVPLYRSHLFSSTATKLYQPHPGLPSITNTSAFIEPYKTIA